ncbi:TPA: MBL fold metallo-hydrolase [Vibrio cholerae]|uniref:ComEC/Rec2 family competence protein n=1 Tax=Vibrio cholerae TaxID=666 RepID=UPI0015842335|nr:MBL fold metallo-hydrolase [Vibrio cholerae]EHY0954725.1 MBL fold metallo-hydrolase [Vibrio cholerae]EJL6368371.1 MBL fold metallo-hydrolase [Vibrio cholerae]EJL6908851.1 MBL fold metallo-hydrolase [Vibrio cholerae]EJO4002186.1 MBL fold metallo-hydrolase [Vibrio cholerae]EKJ1030597.1 MBL fold metallo-hydrolase [Vibrio cholerae]
MPYEVDFHAVGEESKSGDAISIRIKDNSGQSVIVIDGGYKNDGKKVAEHITRYYDTDVIDLIISTHPDSDHINGLSYLVENMDVKKLMISKPWEFDNLKEHFKDGRFTNNSLGEKIAECLNKAVDLVDLASEKGIEIITPSTGKILYYSSAELVILGPSEDYYKELLPQILVEQPAQNQQGTVGALLKDAYDAVVNMIKSIWGEDNLSEDVVTSPLNSTSIITLINSDGNSLLFTGDTGVEALTKAYPTFKSFTYASTLKMFQIPHHGSRHNISSSVLDNYIGNRVSQGETHNISAICSAAINAEKHPRSTVVNALIHRGAKVVVTKGQSIRHHHQMGDRHGWTPVQPLEYFQEVEA